MSGITMLVPNAVLPKLSPSSSVVDAMSGMMWAFASFADLVGAPLARTLVNTGTNSYKYGQVFSGLAMCIGFELLCVPAVHITRQRFWSTSRVSFEGPPNGICSKRTDLAQTSPVNSRYAVLPKI